ncbi:hypothetical protein Goarm_000593 [Gossypium armourianum]|uniref:O-fucosyltransferase family protein n=1 Tax=Gossypium armourianum TaxID=34283 RepID=A0A7J9KAB8_9ROSI|nr:hypothetical protein [Gossypium armourianum]
MVAIARYLNVTLIVPKFAHGTYWNNTSKFDDIFYVNHFITSLRDEVKVLKELPPEQKRKAESEPLYYIYSQDGWRHKPIASNKKRKHGLCPLTPEETALVLQALDIDKNITIYIAAEEIYNKEKRMADLVATYPNLTILNPEELEPFMEHADQMAAMDYIVAIESDIFMPTFVGNMAVAVQGHRGHSLLTLLLTMKFARFHHDEFSLLVKKIHEDRTGKRAKRKENPDHARQEDSFYSNRQDCLPTFASTIN